LIYRCFDDAIVDFEIKTEKFKMLRPNLEGFVYKNWKEGEGGGTEGRIQ